MASQQNSVAWEIKCHKARRSSLPHFLGACLFPQVIKVRPLEEELATEPRPNHELFMDISDRGSMWQPLLPSARVHGQGFANWLIQQKPPGVAVQVPSPFLSLHALFSTPSVHR